MTLMVSVMSLGYELCELSNPFDINWVIALKRRTLDRALIIVGSGVTADEYNKLLTANNVVCTLISVQDFKNRVCEKNTSEHPEPLFIFASPSSGGILNSIAKEANLLPEKDYLSYHQLIRNRAVFDLRNVTDPVNQIEFAKVLNAICKINTLGGVDILVKTPCILPLIDVCVKMYESRLNIKYVLYPSVKDFAIKELVLHHYAMEINFINTNIPHEIAKDFLSTLESYLLQDPKAYVLMTNEQMEMLGVRNHHRIFLDAYHPEYYDGLLSDFEANAFDFQTCYKVKPGKFCLSRRMFPVIDGAFKLKTCSLYENLSLTDFSIEDLHNDTFIKLRQQLCVRCSASGLHRLI